MYHNQSYNTFKNQVLHVMTHLHWTIIICLYNIYITRQHNMIMHIICDFRGNPVNEVISLVKYRTRDAHVTPLFLLMWAIIPNKG